MFAELINLPYLCDYTSHSFRQTGATILADAGIDMINLKRMRLWKSDSCVEGYLANSKYIKKKRATTLVNQLDKAGDCVKQAKLTDGSIGKSGESNFPADGA